TFGASGLPVGLSMNSATGEISGTPTAAGTYVVTLSAFNGTDTITMNRIILIVPNGSQFHWIFSGGLPTGTLLVEYGRTNPQLVLATANPAPGAGVTYSVSGLPEGLSYDVSSGVLSGTPTEPGIYPTVFTATDSASGQTITLAYDMVVLPPNGGDVNSLPVNLWVKKLGLKVGTDGKEAWAAQWIFNSNRTKDKIFDPKFDNQNNLPGDSLIIKLGGIPELNLASQKGGGDKLEGGKPLYTFKSAKGTNPARAVKLDLSNMTLSFTGKNETIPDSVPSTMANKISLGSKGYKLDLFVDSKGKFTSTSGYRKTAFVVASGKVTSKAAGKDSLALSMLLADPSFGLTSNGNLPASGFTVKFSMTSTSTKQKIAEDFTGIVTSTLKSGVYKLKSGKDATAPIGKFQYDSKSGKLAVSLKSATLTGVLAATEDHVTVEVTIGEKQYFTGVTLFAPKAGSYSTKMPK
ncbi:MAG TPA: Ig domain-containing protein, partial [Planctomycetota bacterium]|nr:Ig domain-containing protein [Planctomycetota bacterium]